MTEAERVPYLVRGEHCLAGHHHLVNRRGAIAALCRQERLDAGQEESAVVAGVGHLIRLPVMADGPDSMRVHPRCRTENLAGAWVGDATPARETALVAVDPKDERVADIHRIHVGGRIPDFDGV